MMEADWLYHPLGTEGSINLKFNFLEHWANLGNLQDLRRTRISRRQHICVIEFLQTGSLLWEGVEKSVFLKQMNQS